MVDSLVIDGSWCSQCEAIDFDTFLHASVDLKSEYQQFPTHELGTLEEISGTSQCTLCRLLYAVRAPVQALDPSDYDEFHSYQLVVVYSPDLVAREKPARSLFLGVFPQGQTPPRNWLPPAEQQYIVPVVKEEYQDCEEFQTGALVELTSISYNQIKLWISKCMTEHPQCCHVSVKRPPGLQCIDCITKQVVPLPDGAIYIALSYVWGKPSSNVSTSVSGQNNITNRGISQPVPPVVQDAITVVLELNQQYLWVDAFCIDQNDPKIKHEQISRMDQIYEGSLLTIIASASSDANTPLPGVGRPRLPKQLSAQKGQLKLAATLYGMSKEVSSTVWATRGWTYQEAAVSRRCLYLTDTQAYFLCPLQSCSEALPHASLDVGRDHMGSLSTEIRFGHSAPGSELRQLAQHLKEFTGRNLTFQSDILNAFRGLLGRSGFPSYFGIVIAPADHTTSMASIRRSPIKAHIGMARGLFWIPARSNSNWMALTRFQTFPSWSWTGWKGPVEYPESCGPGQSARGGPMMDYDRSFSHIKVWVEDAQRNLEKLDKKLLSASSKRFLRELSPYIHVQGQTAKIRLQAGRFDGDDLIVCHCHPNGEHVGKIEEEDVLASFIPCTSTMLNASFTKHLLGESWTALILFRSRYYGEVSHSMLILNTEGDFAHRIGAITIRRPLPNGMVQTRQTIRIG